MTDRDKEIAQILRAERADSFGPYFTDRVMRRFAGSPVGSFYDSLRWVFVRAAIACVILIVAVGALNLTQFESADGGSWVDALFGLPSSTLADMLTYNLI